MNDNFYELKRKKLPLNLYKFYSPTIENISDVQNRLLWLASPDTFNDPYDCKLLKTVDIRSLFILLPMAMQIY